MGIVADHHLQQMKDLQALEKLATWKRMNGFDRIAADDNQWVSRPLPLTPKQFTQKLWSEVNVLKDAISMPARTRPWQKPMKFIDGPKGKLPDVELTTIKRYVERRSREAAQVTVTPVSIVQHYIPCSPNPEMSPDVCFSLESNEGKVDPERDELESPSAGTGFETPGQQCHPIWETGRTAADGFLTAGVGSNLGKHTSSTTKRVDTRAVRTTMTSSNSLIIIFLQQGHETKDKEKGSQENKQFDPGGEGGEQPLPWNAVVMAVFSFLERTLGLGCRLFLLRVFCFCVPACLLFSLFIHTIRGSYFQPAEKHERRRGSSR